MGSANWPTYRIGEGRREDSTTTNPTHPSNHTKLTSARKRCKRLFGWGMGLTSLHGLMCVMGVYGLIELLLTNYGIRELAGLC